MKLSKILLFLFYFFSLLSVLGILFHEENLFLISKTCLFPCILFYYFHKMKRLDYVFLTILFIYYSIDILLILDVKYLLYYSAFLLNINHFIILGYSIRNIEIKKIDLTLFLFAFFMFLLGGFIEFLIFDLINTLNKIVVISMFLSGIIVTFFNSIALYNYLLRSNFINLYFGFGCLCIALMYACFDIYKYVYDSDVLKILSLIFKIATYYLFIKFILAKERYNYKIIS